MSKKGTNERKKGGAGLVVLLVVLLLALGGVLAGTVLVLTGTDTKHIFYVSVSEGPESPGEPAEAVPSEGGSSVSRQEETEPYADLLTDSPAEETTAAAGVRRSESAASSAAPVLSSEPAVPETLPVLSLPEINRTSITDEESLALLKQSHTEDSFWDGCPERTIDLLTPNPYSRPQYALQAVHDIVIHYVGNTGSTAKENRDYFESLAVSGATSASSHFVIGLEGEIIQCVPLSEVAYASKNRNNDTISIEVCHPDDEGKFGDATYESVVKLTAWLCWRFKIGPDAVIRHYDVTGKVCPKYYVEHEDAWEQLKNDISQEYIRLGV